MNENNLGIKLRELRKSKGLKLKDVANYLGVSNGYISRIERGSSIPSNNTLSILSKLYETNIEQISNNIEEEENDNIDTIELLNFIINNNFSYKGIKVEPKDIMNIIKMTQLFLDTDKEKRENLLKTMEYITKMLK